MKNAKKIIYFTWGLTMLLGYTTTNLVALVQWTLVDGRKPVFDVQRKVAAGGVVVNNGMTGQMEVL